MYIAMNNFWVNPDRGEDFEKAWRERDSFLADTPGFREFHLLKGPMEDELQRYASHTLWDDEATFTAWTESEAFRKAHSQGRLTGVIARPPKFLGWTVLDMK